MYKIKKYLFLCSSALLTLGLATHAHAGPEGGNVAAGNANIAHGSKVTDIHQSSNKAIIDWTSFDVAADEAVNFHQPDRGSITLNRIHDHKASQIDGSVKANGHVMILNQNGVVFGAGSKVDVGSLTVSSSDIDNDDFMAGRYNFEKAGKSDAAIINHGTMTAKEAGLISLVAPEVENNGVIIAKLGKVQMAAADTFSLDLAGDGLIQVAVSNEEAKKLASNTGRISAQGGYVAITAGRARNIVDSIVENSGVIEAHSMTKVGGKIVLSADHGITKVSGTMNANGLNGGGSIKIGGDYQGKGEDNTANSARTLVSKKAVINASATQTGNGGEVIVWADEDTYYYGGIEAKGGAVNGDGGFVEVSGKDTLTYAGFTDTRAESGNNGTLLLDPTNITISTAADSANNINTSTLATNLAGGNVTITTSIGGSDDGNISVNDEVNVTSVNNLTLNADNDITLDAHIYNWGTGGLTLNAGGDGIGDITVNQSINVGGNAALTSNGGTTYVNANLFTESDLILNSAVQLGIDTVLNASNGTLSIGAGGIDAGTHALTLRASDFIIGGNLSGSDDIAFWTYSGGAGVGIGDGASGAMNFSDSALSKIVDGWREVTFYDHGSSDIDVHYANWDDAIEFRTDNGLLTISNAGLASSNSVRLNAQDFDIGGSVTTSEVLYIITRYDLGIGSGQAGAGSLDDIELGYLVDGSGSNSFYHNSGGTMNIGAYSWSNSARFVANNASSTININGVQNASNYRIDSGGDLNISANIIGAGSLTFSGVDSIGDNAANTDLTDAELAYLQDGWSGIAFSVYNSGDITVDTDTYEFLDNVSFNAADNITIDSVLRAASGSDARFKLGGSNNNADNVYINADIDLSAGDGTGEIIFEDIDNLIIGADLITAAEEITFRDSVLDTSLSASSIFDAGSGVINIGAGGITSGSNDLTIKADEIEISGALSGTGDIQLTSAAIDQDIEIGSNDASRLNITAAELAYLQDGWSSITIGDDNHEAAIYVNEAVSFSDHTHFLNALVGGKDAAVNVNAALTITDNSDLYLQGRGNTDSQSGYKGVFVNAPVTVARDMHTTSNFGDSRFTDDMQISVGRNLSITAGNNTYLLGDFDVSGDFDINYRNSINNGYFLRFSDNVVNVGGDLTMISGSSGYLYTNTASNISVGGNVDLNARSIVLEGGLSTTSNGNVLLASKEEGHVSLRGPLTLGGSGNLTVIGDEIEISTDLSGSGNIQLTSADTELDIEIGSNDASRLNITAAELAYLQDGWNSILIGGSNHRGSITVNESVSFSDHTHLRNYTGASGDYAIDINANVTTLDNSDLYLYGRANGSSAHTWRGVSTASWATLDVARDLFMYGNTSSLSVAGAIVTGRDYLSNGNDDYFYNSIDVGRDFMHSSAWQIHMQSNASIAADGDITISVPRIALDSNSSISGNSDGSSALFLREYGQNNDMEIGGTSHGATWQMSAAEIATIQDGFSSITFGSSSQTAAIAITGATSFSDDVNFYNTGSDATIAVTGALTTTDGASVLMQSGTAANIGWDAINIDADLDIAGDLRTNSGDGTGSGHVDVNTAHVTVGGDWLIDSDNDGFFNIGTLNVNGDLTGYLGTKGQDLTTYQFNVTDALIGGDLNLTSHDLLQLNGDFDVMGNVILDNTAGNNQNITLQNGTMNFSGGVDLISGNNILVSSANLTTNGNVIFNSDRDADQDGAIRLINSSVNTNGGDFIAGGGADPTTTYAYGNSIYDEGVNIYNSNIITGAGNVVLRGYGLDDAATSQHNGVNISNGASVTSTSGDITIAAVGGDSSNNSYGLHLSDGTITSQTGDIDIYAENGVAGGGGNTAIVIFNNGVIESTGSGAIDITLGGTSANLNIGAGGVNRIGSSTMTNDITLLLDDAAINDSDNSLVTQGNIYVATNDDSASILLGKDAGGYDLRLNDNELSQFNAGGSLIIGDSVNGTGNVTIDSWNLSGKAYDVEVYGGALDIGGLTMGTGNFLAHAQNGKDLTVSADIVRSAAGTANLDLRADSNITLSAVNITEDTGALNVILNADRDADQLGAIEVSSSTIMTNGGDFTAGGGATPLSTAAYGNSTYNYGVRFLSSTLNANAGDINITGNGWNGSTSSSTDSAASGVYMITSDIESTSGDLNIFGTAGATSAGNFNIGVYIKSGSNVITQSGDLYLYGQGGTKGSSKNGVVISNTGVNSVETTSGSINVDAYANGTTSGSAGIYNNTTGAGGIRSFGSGTITLNDHSGLLYLSDGIIGGSSATGDITLIGDRIHIGDTVQTTGDINIRPFTDGISIGLGTGAGTLSLTDAELANIATGGTLSIGSHATTHNGFINTWDLSGTAYDVEVLMNDINLLGLTLGGGNVTLNARNDITLNTAIDHNAQGGDIYFVAGNEFINNVGQSAIDTGNGRYLIYAASPLQVTKNGLSASNLYERTYALNPPESLSSSGDYFVFASVDNNPPRVDNSDSILQQLPAGVEYQVGSDYFNDFLFNLPDAPSSRVSNSISGTLQDTPVGAQKSNALNRFARDSEGHTEVVSGEAQLLEVEEPVVREYDLCSFSMLYCQ